MQGGLAVARHDGARARSGTLCGCRRGSTLRRAFSSTTRKTLPRRLAVAARSPLQQVRRRVLGHQPRTARIREDPGRSGRAARPVRRAGAARAGPVTPASTLRRKPQSNAVRNVVNPRAGPGCNTPGTPDRSKPSRRHPKRADGTRPAPGKAGPKAIVRDGREWTVRDTAAVRAASEPAEGTRRQLTGASVLPTRRGKRRTPRPSGSRDPGGSPGIPEGPPRPRDACTRSRRRARRPHRRGARGGERG
jgi:hypothetical protein